MTTYTTLTEETILPTKYCNWAKIKLHKNTASKISRQTIVFLKYVALNFTVFRLRNKTLIHLNYMNLRYGHHYKINKTILFLNILDDAKRF